MSPKRRFCILRKALLIAVLMLAATVHTASAEDTTTTTTTPTAQELHRAAVREWRGKVRHRRLRAQYLAAGLGINYRPGRIEMHTRSPEYLRWIAGRLRHRNHRYMAIRHRRIPKLLCIHSHEGSWTAYNPAGHYGGFQMDWSFMRHWGADKLHKYGGHDARSWSPRDQIAVASRAASHIGFGPWPNTAAMCGLL